MWEIVPRAAREFQSHIDVDQCKLHEDLLEFFGCGRTDVLEAAVARTGAAARKSCPQSF